MGIQIDGLYEVKDLDRLVNLFYRAFYDYPKLMEAFAEENVKNAALEATICYYCAYDLKYGKAYALDEEVHEAVIFVESEEMHYTEARYEAAGCSGPRYRKAVGQLTKKQDLARIRLFEELDLMEEDLNLPDPHFYIDFLGVDPQWQRQGRGRKLMAAICAYAEKRNRPIMLFTNTKEDVAFYLSLGFRHAGETRSKLFGFTSWYLVKE